MVNKRVTGGTRFTVDLGDIKLPSSLAKALEKDIQKAVLHRLAEADLLTGWGIGRLPPDLYGIIFDPRVPPRR